MIIDFSKGIDYWVGIVKQLLVLIEDLFESTVGIKIFADEETTA